MNNQARATRSVPTGIPLNDQRRVELLAQIRSRGESAVMVASGVSRIAMVRAAAGLGVRRGTLRLLEDGLDRLAAASENEAGR